MTKRVHEILNHFLSWWLLKTNNLKEWKQMVEAMPQIRKDDKANISNLPYEFPLKWLQLLNNNDEEPPPAKWFKT